jgi:DNA helicase-2/ATP-dependent DNA helicase PcrA
MTAFVPSDEQIRVLDHNPTQCGVILAGPGTGKSATLVALLNRLAGLDSPPKIRLLTFTRAATNELARTISAHPSLQALRPSTVHSFAISSLIANRGAASYPQPLRLADKWEQREIVRRTLARRARVTLPVVDVLIRELEANWQALTPEQEVRIPKETRSRFLGSWEEHRRIYGYTMLSELPNLLREALRDHDDLVGLDYTLLIVDEYQDLNPCDLEVLRRLAARGSAILAAGDDEQSIYSFRKAAPEGIRRFLDDYPGAVEYPLSLTRRCAKSIVAWARFVIEGDPDRILERPTLTAVPEAPEGEVALLHFGGHVAEARGVAGLIRHLVVDEDVAPSEILVLVRGDFGGRFSEPIKHALAGSGITAADTQLAERELAEPSNRRSLAMLRLLAKPDDSLAWATLFHLRSGIGWAVTDYVYGRARDQHVPFGRALLLAHDTDWPGLSTRVRGRASALVTEMRAWMAIQGIPDEPPDSGWGRWVLSVPIYASYPGFTPALARLIGEVGDVVEPDLDLERFLSQLGPLGDDLLAERSGGVRFMSMTRSKGLTVEAVIVVACEEDIIPRLDAPSAEERRLLYVAMTRARRFLYCTWAKRRTGPTARAGRPRVQERRTVSSLLRNGPASSEDGASYLATRSRGGSARDR